MSQQASHRAIEPDSPNFRAFLHKQLPKLTEADPSALSDYIIALLKNHAKESIQEQHSTLVTSLGDFLGPKQASIFVSRMMDFLETGQEKEDQPKRKVHESKTERRDRASVSRKDQRNEQRHSRDYHRQNSVEDRHRQDRHLEGRGRRHYERTTRQAVPVYTQSYPLPPALNRPHRSPEWNEGNANEGNQAAPLSPSIYPNNALANGGVTQIISSIKLPIRTKRRSHNTLVVDRIPHEQCTRKAVHDYFAQFGSLILIEVSPGQKRARVTFSSSSDAERAMSNPDAVLGNRFVRVYWDNALQRSMQSRHTIPPAVSIDALPPAVASEDEHIKRLLDLQRQSQDLLDRYIEQQKQLIASLETSNTLVGTALDDETKATMQQSLTFVDSMIQSMRESMAKTNSQLTTLRQQQQKQQHLKPAMHSKLSVDFPPRYVPHHPSAVVHARQQKRIDFRPTTITVTPFTEADLGLLPTYGQVIQSTPSIDPANSELACTVRYTQRYEAEKAFNAFTSMGRKVSWVQTLIQQEAITTLAPDNSNSAFKADNDVQMMDNAATTE